jgi:hypothetical protein
MNSDEDDGDEVNNGIGSALERICNAKWKQAQEESSSSSSEQHFNKGYYCAGGANFNIRGY